MKQRAFTFLGLLLLLRMPTFSQSSPQPAAHALPLSVPAAPKPVPKPAPTVKPAPAPCTTPEYHQFDFWIGDWEVYVGDQLAGTNRIDRILDGCVLMENWVGSKGGTGHSFNVYDSNRQQWEQTWVDNGGGIVHFYGTFADGKMSLAGTTYNAKGQPSLTKLTFWHNTDGTVRQLWESSADDGKSWVILFDGLYKKKI
jgi:hypothetical protein